MDKKTLISLQLSAAELELLNELSARKDMSKTAIIRQALRMMGVIERRLEQGEKFYFETADKQKAEVLLL
ncbi:ribbon-helix-helix protein, CopG family [Gloeobacter kilaueensis]|uniref:Transcriptional regulator n=1 Tax=Gloeobacter kilaueensis (strain ATCC BAA-2537 / CCAP 1431/1 / ULC 316 / JS1) TaxID=1183438 RepID=U5QGJ2_GLOK1|nr:ribbon-helix-helix protein, CopG family [Gloeobacter kilaueensis]AGY58041.1 transcriptional regulator [Gloeobacter kilaueensis JS1]